MKKISNFRKKLLWLFLLLVLVLIYPFEATVVPRQRVLVVTEDWHPIAGARVRQSWQNYSIEADGHEEDVLTDENGRVTLPPRINRASLAWRLFRPVANIITQGIHAGFGTYAKVSELGGGTERRDAAPVESQAGDVVFRRR
jgi:hypothetical protein